MWGFSIGIITFVVALLIPAIYVLSRGASWFQAWLNNTEKPNDKMIVKIVLGLIIGFVLGGMLQYFWDAFVICKDSGYPLLQCFSRK